MPPAAKFDYPPIEEPYDSFGDIEIETVLDDLHVTTRIEVLPRSQSLLGCQSVALSDGGSDRFSYFSNNNEKCLADSFDSVDQIDENSNEARLIKSLAARATIVPYDLHSGLGDPREEASFALDHTEARYLDVLDRHLMETDPESTSFHDLETGPDDPHPRKMKPTMDQVMEHLLDNPCCECSPTVVSPRPKPALLPSRYLPQHQKDARVIPRSYSRSPDEHVQFKEIDIHEFKMTLGDHPSATSGPPVTMDWNCHFKNKKLDLETYEKARQPRRNRRQLKLSLQQRHQILVKERGFSFEEVKGAWQEALEIRKLRKQTLERGLALMKWDEVWESTCRKFNRLVDG